MRITFKGIENPKFYKNENSQKGYYIDENKDSHLVVVMNKHVKINCKLTNDNTGKELHEYKAILENLKNVTKTDFKNELGDDVLEIRLDREEKFFENGQEKHNQIILNNKKLNLCIDKQLPIFSFLAKITSKIATMPTTTKAEKHYTDMLNDGISLVACEYLGIDKTW